MTIEELKEKGAIEFLTEGPNSGGVSGYYYLDGMLYSFWDDFSNGGISGVSDAKSFIETYENDSNEKYCSIARQLKNMI